VRSGPTRARSPSAVASAGPLATDEARRGGLVSVYQEPALIPDLDIRSNLRLTETPLEPFRHWLGELGLPDLDLSAIARRVPLASLRIVDLARALAIEPDVLMLDEMSAALPADLTERVLEVIGRLRGGERRSSSLPTALSRSPVGPPPSSARESPSASSTSRRARRTASSN
jgi:ABC-type multidrug transport system ATPase subunit